MILPHTRFNLVYVGKVHVTNTCHVVLPFWTSQKFIFHCNSLGHLKIFTINWLQKACTHMLKVKWSYLTEYTYTDTLIKFKQYMVTVLWRSFYLHLAQNFHKIFGFTPFCGKERQNVLNRLQQNISKTFIRLLSFNLTYNKDTQTACYVTKVLVLKHPTYYSKCFNSPQISWISTQPHMQRQW